MRRERGNKGQGRGGNEREEIRAWGGRRELGKGWKVRGGEGKR